MLPAPEFLQLLILHLTVQIQRKIRSGVEFSAQDPLERATTRLAPVEPHKPSTFVTQVQAILLEKFFNCSFHQQAVSTSL